MNKINPYSLHYLQFYPEFHAGRQGSMASFAFRLLLARLPSFLGFHKTTLDRLTEMATTCEEIKTYYAQDNSSAGSANAVDFWERRHVTVLNALVNCSLTVSISTYQSIIIAILRLINRL